MKKSIKARIVPILGIIALVAIMGFSMIACDDGGKSSGKVRNIDITGAKALMIASSSYASASRSARAVDGNVFLKQLDDGSWVEVSITNDEGSKINNLPMYVRDIADDWMVIGFFTDNHFQEGNKWEDRSGSDWVFHDMTGYHYNFYLVRKTNGDAYDITSINIPQDGWASTDKNGNVYYRTSSSPSDQNVKRIVKITPGSTQATAEFLTLEQIIVDSFAIDNDGNIMYWYYANNNTNYRLRTASGTVLALDTLDLNGTVFFTGPDGYIYGNFGGNYLSKAEITGNTLDDITITPVYFSITDATGSTSLGTLWVQSFPNFGDLNGSYAHYGSYASYSTDKLLVFNGERTLSFSKDGSAKCVYLTSGTIVGNITEITLGSTDFFLLVVSQILTVDPDTGIVTTLVASGTYDLIYRFEVSGNDIITINALTFDQKKILANIYPNGETVILSENFSDTETLVLAKVR